MACPDWAATKAAYQFFDNPRLDDGVILGGHVAATAARFAVVPGSVLVLHDTTEFSFVVWRGLTRLADILRGYELNAESCG